MKEIGLTQGQVALVDDEDYEWLSQWKWYAVRNRDGNFYAERQSPRKRGKQYGIRMHRQLLGLEYKDPRQGDHQNHNTLDNCRNNIRICTRNQNLMNQRSLRGVTSKFKGVCWYKLYKKWNAQIGINGKRKNLGYFELEELAALAYDMAAIHEFGEFAKTNF